MTPRDLKNIPTTGNSCRGKLQCVNWHSNYPSIITCQWRSLLVATSKFDKDRFNKDHQNANNLVTAFLRTLQKPYFYPIPISHRRRGNRIEFLEFCPNKIFSYMQTLKYSSFCIPKNVYFSNPLTIFSIFGFANFFLIKWKHSQCEPPNIKSVSSFCILTWMVLRSDFLKIFTHIAINNFLVFYTAVNFEPTFIEPKRQGMSYIYS